MTHSKLVIYPAIDDSRFKAVRAAAGEMQIINCLDVEQARREIADADAIFGKITPDLLSHAQNLRWVQTATASLEHYLFPELIEHPCTLTNMRGLFSDVVADHVMGFVLCFARNLHLYIRNQAVARWAAVGGEAARVAVAAGPGHESEIDRAHLHLADTSLGVVGTGAIGSEILCRAKAFGMRLCGVDPIVREIPGVLEEVWPIDKLPKLLAESDFVVLAAPHTPRTAGLFGPGQFSQMRRNGILINIGRGAIVRLDALTDALQQGIIAGAALDVYEIEPLPVDHPLWKMPQVILTPHIAAASTRVPERHLTTLLENVRRFASGEELLNVVNKREWF